MSIKDSQKLKQLQSRKARLEIDVEMLSRNSKEANSAYAQAKNKLMGVIQELRQHQGADITVSEHAVVRYLERGMNLDIDSIKAKILSEDTTTLIKNLGNGKYPIGGGLKAVVRDNVVVTVA